MARCPDSEAADSSPGLSSTAALPFTLCFDCAVNSVDEFGDRLFHHAYQSVLGTNLANRHNIYRLLALSSFATPFGVNPFKENRQLLRQRSLELCVQIR